MIFSFLIKSYTMKKTLAIVVLLLAALGAGGFAYLQWKASAGAKTEITTLTEKATTAEQKQGDVEKELEELKEKLGPLQVTAQQMEAVKAAFASGVTMKDLEAAYAKDKNLSAERLLGLAGVRLLTKGGQDPATVSAFEKALEMTDWTRQQKVICAAQYALAAAGKEVKPLSECAMPTQVAKAEGKADDKSEADKKETSGAKKDDKHAAVHWDYEGLMGPENWGKEFPKCARGKEQAPLDIKGPMVVHFVHKSSGGELAVLGVLLQMGNENPVIKTLWEHAPAKEGPEQQPEGVAFNPANLLPRELDFYHYDGSLTTPPCTEKVKFYILRSMVNISREQVAQFPFKMNARPLQPLNERVIMSN
ncbi:MAG: carbonic anhydrase family protein [Hylemonella sp.]